MYNHLKYGKVSFWTSEKKIGTINLYVDGIGNIGEISSYFQDNIPNCGQGGTLMAVTNLAFIIIQQNLKGKLGMV